MPVGNAYQADVRPEAGSISNRQSKGAVTELALFPHLMVDSAMVIACTTLCPLGTGVK